MVTYTHLGFDPVSSSELIGADIATELRNATNSLGEVKDVLHGSGDQDWEGKTAEAFRSAMSEDLRPRVDDAYQSFSTASRSFDAWVEDLPGFRRRADQLEEEAATVAARVSTATSDLAGLQKPDDDAEKDAKDTYDDDRTSATSTLTTAQGDLEDVLGRARGLRDEVVVRAGEVAGALNTAMAEAPDEPGLFGKIGEGLGDLVSAIGEWAAKAFDWFMENLAPILQKLAKVIGALATIVAIVAFVVGFVFPPAFALASAAATVAKVASFVDLGIQGLRVLHGEEGALQGFLIQGGSMLLGMGMAKAIGPIATNATSNIKTGLFVPQLSLAGAGGTGGAAVATVSYSINNDFFQSLAYWGVTSYQGLNGSLDTLEDET